MNCIMIGIAGGSGSGKSTFTNRLKKEFGDQVTVIYHDNYYKSNDGIPFEVRQKVNYDHPDAFETDLLIAHLKALRRGECVQCPVYNYAEHNRSQETTELRPSRIIIVEASSSSKIRSFVPFSILKSMWKPMQMSVSSVASSVM